MIVGLVGVAYAASSEVISNEDLRAALLDYPLYSATDENAAPCPAGSSTTLVGSENAEKVYNFFVGKGYKPWQAAGIIGNMAAESGVEPQRLQGTAPGVITTADQALTADAASKDGIGWGIVQWTPAAKMINPTKAAGKDPNDLGVQLEFLWNQLEGNPPLPEKRAGDELKLTPDYIEATKAFQGTLNVGGKYYGFERPADQSATIDFRISEARKAFEKFGNGTPASSGSVVPARSCSGSGSGQIVGGFSLPVARRHYDENPIWFTQPRHDRPAADIPVPDGTEVYSMTAGKIIAAPAGDKCGRGVIIEAASGILFIYCHGSDGGDIPGARNGDTVIAGQLIMHSGYTGHVDPPGPGGSHLHLQINVGEEKKCPQTLFTGIANGSPPDVRSLPSSGCTYDSGGALD